MEEGNETENLAVRNGSVAKQNNKYRFFYIFLDCTMSMNHTFSGTELKRTHCLLVIINQ